MGFNSRRYDTICVQKSGNAVVIVLRDGAPASRLDEVTFDLDAFHRTSIVVRAEGGERRESKLKNDRPKSTALTLVFLVLAFIGLCDFVLTIIRFF